ncbi:MAG: Transcriptional regulatory protein KdpE [Phycisphaerae bacterium]|nr:Transcriptional regulatory protein KdpE [Phycisphaerae bacterium]
MGAKPRVLLVDDDRDIARGLGIRFRAAGYDIVVAHDGRSGLEEAIKHPPDAIVLDMRMPVLDGLGVLGGLSASQQTASIPVVMLSASVVEKSKSQALDLGARFFLEKPYEAPQLLEAVGAALSAGRRASAGAATETGETS